jgi:hypothetical protein
MKRCSHEWSIHLELYWQITLFGGCCWKPTSTCIFGLVEVWANLHKTNFILYFPNQNILIIKKGYIEKGTWLNHHEHQVIWLNYQDDPHMVKPPHGHEIVSKPI